MFSLDGFPSVFLIIGNSSVFQSGGPDPLGGRQGALGGVAETWREEVGGVMEQNIRIKEKHYWRQKHFNTCL